MANMISIETLGWDQQQEGRKEKESQRSPGMFLAFLVHLDNNVNKDGEGLSDQALLRHRPALMSLA